MNIEISAVVCTHNRATYLDQTLNSLAIQNLGQERFEVLVIDSASSDETPQVFAKFAYLPHWRYFRESVPGLSIARNAGWKNARGTYVAFIDDDAVASPDWLANYVAAFYNMATQPGCLGGRCLPIWEAARPVWLPDSLMPAFSIFHYSDEPLVLGPRQQLTGCNFAFPKEVLKQVGGFREDLGRQGSNLLANEDVDMRERLDHLGLSTVYHPGIIVEHHIPAQRLTKKWFYQRAYWQGISQVRMSFPASALSTPGRLLNILKKVVWASIRLGLMLFTFAPDARFRRELQLREAAGYISAMWQLRPGMTLPAQRPAKGQEQS